MSENLRELITDTSSSYSQLIQRLQGFANDLYSLSEICSKAGAYSEADRLKQLMQCVRHTLDCDLKDVNVYCGRSVMRIDLIENVLQESHFIQQELRNCAEKARLTKDYTIIASAEKVYKTLTQLSDKVLHTIKPFTLFDKVDGAENIDERITSEGTSFIDSDYLLQVECGPGQHNLSSLAIMASASVILNDIRVNWPNLTTFGNNQSSVIVPSKPSFSDIENSVLDFSKKASIEFVIILSPTV
jgi:hypothetical protein